MKLFSFYFLILWFISGCGETDVPASTNGHLKKVRLGLNWFPEAEHGGYYTANLEGIFKSAGLEVEIQKGGPSAPVIQKVASGQIEFGIANADDVLNAQASGADVVAVFAPIQDNPRCLMFRKETGIQSFEDIKNITLAMSARPSFSHFLKSKYPFDNVKIVPYPPSLQTFLSQKKFGQQAYNISEPYLVRQQGGDATILMVSDTGFNPYCSVLITSRKYINNQSLIVKKMVHGSKEGWELYLAKPKTTNEWIHSLNKRMDLETLQYGAQLLKKMVYTPEVSNHGLGVMTDKRWRTLEQQMSQAGLIKPGQLDIRKAWTPEYIRHFSKDASCCGKDL